ncbi:SGNH hydrolase-type esterase domain-containing protein [Powellomyces hirtus]|nr:SGNH hydrolase-type esterase domain-containing protein [Powellomyces hirtus]
MEMFPKIASCVQCSTPSTCDAAWRSTSPSPRRVPKHNTHLPVIPSALAATTLHLAGDSTGATGGSGGTLGWGGFLQDYFYSQTITVNNAAVAGRSSRTFITEGHWTSLMSKTKPNDVVMIQFGHNDQSPLTDSTRSRGVIRGIGEEFQDTVNGVTGQPERVFSFGHYLRTMVADTRAKGAIPVLVSKTLTKKWNNATNGVARGDQWSEWSLAVSKSEKTAFLDMRQIAADGYDTMGISVLDTFFPIDGTHTSPEGARFNTESIIKAIRCVRLPVVRGMSRAGQNVYTPKVCHNSAPIPEA